MCHLTRRDGNGHVALLVVVRDAHLAAADKSDKGDEGIGDGLLNLVLAILAMHVAKCDLRVADDLRQHVEKDLVPAPAGSGRSGRGGCGAGHSILRSVRPS